MRRSLGIAALVVSCLFVSRGARGEEVSGPEKGAKLEPLKVHPVAGDDAGKVIDIVERREDKATIYVIVQADLFSRPIGRFLKELDTKINNDVPDTEIVAVWLTDDVDKSKEYLPRAQMSIQLVRTNWTVFDGDKSGPPEWGINGDAHVTVVAAKKGVALKSVGYVSINETVVADVVKMLAE